MKCLSECRRTTLKAVWELSNPSRRFRFTAATGPTLAKEGKTPSSSVRVMEKLGEQSKGRDRRKKLVFRHYCKTKMICLLNERLTIEQKDYIEKSVFGWLLYLPSCIKIGLPIFDEVIDLNKVGHRSVCREYFPEGKVDVSMDQSISLSASVHNKVLLHAEVGALSPFGRIYYLNITVRNVVKVFKADIGPPTEELLNASSRPVNRPYPCAQNNNKNKDVGPYEKASVGTQTKIKVWVGLTTRTTPLFGPPNSPHSGDIAAMLRRHSGTGTEAGGTTQDLQRAPSSLGRTGRKTMASSLPSPTSDLWRP
ncbi:uncharacterized protein HKW66_Vig0153080 [Vigna angularis]|uniref:Uncharacterized protein n=1 Tax=Phaseolus angularis TaxID=3914 RepID=A0A8T0JTA4_PHAAN|nr:uncharacterized protein HKW66_Vig0153080 [Vigna angularis]